MAINSFEDVDRLVKLVQRFVSSRKLAQFMGEEARRILYRRTKAGFGVTDDTPGRNARKEKLKPLSPGYVEQRRRKGVVGSFGSPARSNLTNTGKMLESIQIETKAGGFELIIPATLRGDGLTNQRVSQFVRLERPFFNLTKAETAIITRLLQKQINRLVKRVVG